MIDSCYLGDVRDGLRAMAAAGVRARTCVTSPPYWGLRDYGVAGQIGLEPTPGEFVERMVEVFRLVRDVLADDGTVWLNLGDSYSQNGGPGWQGKNGERADRRFTATRDTVAMREVGRSPPDGLKPKDLLGIPWRVALALQAEGWWLRQDLIWHKPNPMPESIRDRCTKAHEYLFLLSKRERYYFDQEAIKERSASFGAVPAVDEMQRGSYANRGEAQTGHGYVYSRGACANETRNRRSVWTIPSEPFPEAHFATFPTALVEPCVLAGSAPGDVVLDPFMGSGTVAQVAQALGRRWVGCELNPDYHAMIERRTRSRGLALA